MIYHFDTTDAKAYGTDEAILLYNIIYWLRLNKAERRNQFDGRTWTYNTARALVEVFDEIWSEQQIRRLINKLVDKQVLVKGNYNAEVGRRSDDRTLWLALADETRITPKAKGAKTEVPPAQELPFSQETGLEPPSELMEAPGKTAALPSVENDGGLHQNQRTPPSKMTDASVEFDGHIQEQIETSIGKTSEEKQQQQPLLPPQLPFENAELPDGQTTGTQNAAAAGSLRFEEKPEEKPTQEKPNLEELSPQEQDERRVMAHTLFTLGLKGCDAEALVREFPLAEIQQQLDWLPYQGCENPGYWLPRYIRERWAKPRSLVREEAEAAKQRQREASGLKVSDQRQQEKQAREDKERRRREYRAALDAETAASLRADAEAKALEQSYFQDIVRDKGREARSFQMQVEIEINTAVDRRLEAQELESQKMRGPE